MTVNELVTLFVDALRRSEETREDRKYREERNTRPANAKKIPGLKVGDILWHGDMEDGFSQCVVVNVDSEGYARYVFAAQKEYGNKYDVGWVI